MALIRMSGGAFHGIAGRHVDQDVQSMPQFDSFV